MQNHNNILTLEEDRCGRDDTTLGVLDAACKSFPASILIYITLICFIALVSHLTYMLYIFLSSDDLQLEISRMHPNEISRIVIIYSLIFTCAVIVIRAKFYSKRPFLILFFSAIGGAACSVSMMGITYHEIKQNGDICYGYYDCITKDGAPINKWYALPGSDYFWKR